ncbi:hypothetical protein BaRGS_00005093 [Batillaria attramentaria]|uniref:Apple domain-containing protein n=1 Tax=Batillaria attramentaria TaxID=370345 RepID=A0ABD0LV97_9CAEN
MLLVLIPLMVVSAQNVAVYGGQTYKEGKAGRNRGLDSLVFPGDFLFESSVRSRMDCSRKCLGHVGCAAFTFMGPSATCRGHSSVPTSASPNSPSPGAETWVYYSTTAENVVQMTTALSTDTTQSSGTSAQTTSTESTTVSDCPLENGPAHVGA